MLGCITYWHEQGMAIHKATPTLGCVQTSNGDLCTEGEIKVCFVTLSRTQAGPGRTVKQEQEEISRNHVQTFISPSVHTHVESISKIFSVQSMAACSATECVSAA